jgi:hypothetical protein
MRRRYLATLACASIGLAGPSFAAVERPGLDFDRTFDGRDAGGSHYEAVYRSGGREHRVEVWRDRDLRIARRTDDAVETHLSRRPGDVEWSMTVLDLKRKIRTDIDRTNLLRIGHYTDWFAQANSLSRPRGAYRLVALSAAPAGVSPIAACRWYELTQDDRSNRICWSAAQHVPLVIANGDGDIVWRVTRLTSGPVPARVFAIDDRGFVRNDANQDIQAD